MPTRPSFVLLVLAALAASPASSYLGDNPGFAQDLSSWTQQTGTWSHQAADGYQTDGSAEAIALGENTLTQCVDVSGVAQYRSVVLHARGKAVGHSDPLSVGIDLFDSGDCSGPALSSSFDTRAVPQDIWNLFVVPIGMPAGGAGSALISVGVEHSEAQSSRAFVGNPTRFDAVSLRHDLTFGGTFTTAGELSGWYQIPADSWMGVADGLTSPVAAYEGTATTDGSLFLGQCVNLDVVPNTSRLLSSIKIKAENVNPGNVGGMPPYDYRLSYRFHATENCSENYFAFQTVPVEPPVAGQWALFLNTVSIPKETRSVTMLFALFAGFAEAGDTVIIDDFSSAVDGLFADGFESGDTSAWQ